MSFVHLRVRTEYSVSDSIIRIDDLVSRTVELGMPAVAVTEYRNLYSAIKAYTACVKMGVKPIIGSEVQVENRNNPASPFTLVLLCQNNDGYRALCTLVSRAHNQVSSSGSVLMREDWFTPSSCQGLVALSGAQQGEIGQKLLLNKNDEAHKAISRLREIFDDRFYLEVSRFDGQHEAAYEAGVLELASSTNTPIVATHQPRFLSKEDYEVHEVKVCIQERTSLSDASRRSNYTAEQYFRSADEMSERFADLPNALENSLEIAKRCNLRFNMTKSHMPAYPVSIEEPSIEKYLERLSREGLQKILQGRTDDRYENRLNEELDIICKTNYAGYFLIVADIIAWAKSNGIPVGPGRGSGAGSLVAYCLEITAIDPIEHDLIFERFLNPERVSPPDFDIDFCVRERDRIIERVADRYGRDQVAQIITYNTMAAKAVVRDVGRALRPDYKFYDELARMIPQDLNITLARSLERNKELKLRYNSESRVKELIDTAQALEGMIRNEGKHPGGLVIAPSEIVEYTALFADSDSGRGITHFDKDDLEAIGLVKFDFLGLTTLTVISDTLRRLNERNVPGAPATENDIPLDDEDTFEYIRTGQTVGIFQLESRGMQRLIREIQPDKFSDLVALLALFRPGPLQTGMDKMYIENHNNNSYNALHDDLKEVLDQSHGVILYQEQVMKIAQIMAGYSMGEADILRYAMGKKVKQEMEFQRERFVSGSVEKGYDKKLAAEVYDLMESFAGYGFNKSHSVAYALLAYRTAYLKTHFRTEFLAACMSVDIKVETTAKIYNDSKRQGIEFLLPDINRSAYEFTPVSDTEILYGLGALKQIGTPVVDAIRTARDHGGEFSSLSDFCNRVDLTQISKSTCQVLTAAGAFDSFDSNRAKLFAHVESAYAFAQMKEQEQKSGQMNLFGTMESDDMELTSKEVEPWTRSELLRREHAILGIYISGHPSEKYEKEFKTLLTGTVGQMPNQEDERLILCGWVFNKTVTKARKKGGNNLFFELEGSKGEVLAIIYSENFDSLSKLIVENEPIILVGVLSGEQFNGSARLLVSNAVKLDTVRQHPASEIVLDLKQSDITSDHFRQFRDILEKHRVGKSVVKVRYSSTCGSSARFSLGDDWRVSINEDLLDELQNILGEDSVTVNYLNVPL
ncbi:MAG: DNA polymerase III subunit alpha [Acidiferrobacterales bacterium]|nr:DNA polymerase III subunit alpha [Acidiferrobacterales bacterium]